MNASVDGCTKSVLEKAVIAVTELSEPKAAANHQTPKIGRGLANTFWVYPKSRAKEMDQLAAKNDVLVF